MRKTKEELEQERKKEAERKKAEQEETPVVEQLLGAVRMLQSTMEETTRARADSDAEKAVKEAAARTATAEQKRVDAAIKLSDADEGGDSFELPAGYRMPETLVSGRSYGSAGRTQPVALADWRYRTIPEWQKAFRTPASDLLIASFMSAVRDQDRPTIRAMMDQDRKVRIANKLPLPESMLRADMDIGDSTGGPYDGTVGQLVPLVLSQQLLQALYRTARVERFARVTFGPNVRHPKQSALSSSTWTGESLPIAHGEPEADEFLFLALHDLTNRADLSNRTIRDAFGVVSWLLSDAAGEMQERIDSTFYATGTGTLQPNSLELADTILVGSAPLGHVKLPEQTADNTVPGSLTRGVMQQMLNLVHVKNRGSVRWCGNDTVMQAIANIVDSTGRPIFQNRNEPVGVLDGEFETGSTIDRAFNKQIVQMPGKESADPEVPDETENRLYCIQWDRGYAINRPAGGGDVEIAVTTQSDSAFDNNRTAYRFIMSADGGRLGNSAATGVVDYAYTGAIKLTPA